MDIDIYQQCPCLSGKKIKFCCSKDIITDLNQILAKTQSGQSLSALQQIDRVAEKHGNRDCLMTIKTRILLSVGDIEQAESANREFLKEHPNHLLGGQHKAMIHLAKGELDHSINAIQDAIEAVEGDRIPIAASNGFRIVGVGLLQAGHLLGARAYLMFASFLKGEPDDQLQDLIYRTFTMPGTSLFLKQDLRLDQPFPEEDSLEWNKSYKNVIRLMDRGQFRKALKLALKIDEKYPDQRKVVRGIAILSAINCLPEETPAAWRRYSQLCEPESWDAVEAEAIAQLLTVDPMSKSRSIVRHTFEVDDQDKVSELAIASKQLAQLGEIEKDPFEEGPPPRHAFQLLSCDQVESLEGATLDGLPRILGEVLLFGKQTNRAARIELIVSKGPSLPIGKSFIKETFGSHLQGVPEENVIGETTEVADCLSAALFLPQDTSFEDHVRFHQQLREQTLLNEWVNLQLAVLDDHTPAEAAKIEKYRVPLTALTLHLEQTNEPNAGIIEGIRKLREDLGLSEPESVDPTTMESNFISPARQPYLQFEKLKDEQLLELRSEAMMIGNFRVLRPVMEEILKREHLEDQVPRDISYSILAQTTESTEEALELLKKARQHARQNNRPIGVFYVQEFELRLSRGMTENLDKLFQRIRVNHFEEPNVEYQMGRVLQRFGLLGQEKAGEPQPAAPEEPAAAGKIWTPDGEGESAAAPAGEKSKLWIPGSD